MEVRPPLFQVLVQQKGWQDHEVFKKRYRQAARELADLEGPASLATSPPPEKRQFIRWMQGEVRTVPRSEARRILQYMFPGVRLGSIFHPVGAGPCSSELQDAGECGREGEFESDGEDVVTMAANESARFVARAEGSNVGPHTMEQLEADIRRIVTTYPNRPVGPLFREVRALRNRAFEFLEGRQPPQLTRDLYLAAGVLCGVLANASFDLGRYDAAETQARSAFMCGELAGHNGLRSWVRGLQALIAYWDGRPRDAVRLAEAGDDFTPEQGTSHIRLTSIKARAYGQLQLTEDAVAALRSADTLREQATTDDGPLGGMMAFPREKQLYASTTHLWLSGGDHLGKAEACAGEAVSVFEAAPPEQRRLGELSLARMDLALARLNRGDAHGAALQVYEMLSTDTRRRTESVRRRLGQFGRRLATHAAADSPSAVAVREAIAAHREHPAELPPGGMS